jgi:hypothetical protein
MFISTGGVHLHVFERDDPIFPAHNSVLLRIGLGTPSIFWYNNSTRAGVLGCADSHQICADSRGSLCWDQTNSTDALHYFSHDPDRQRALYLVLVSLMDSDAWSVLNYRRAAALNASSQIKLVIGIRLAPEQWKVEVENIFAASLAGMQIRPFDYVRGTYSHHPNVIDKTLPLLQGGSSDARAAAEVAKMFKFRSSTIRNVSAIGFWGLNALCIVVFLGSRRFSTAARRAELQSRTGDGGYRDYLWATIACKLLFWRPAKAATKWVWGVFKAVTWVTMILYTTGILYTENSSSFPEPSSPSNIGARPFHLLGVMDKESRIHKALDSLKSGLYPSIHKVAKENNVWHTTLTH